MRFIKKNTNPLKKQNVMKRIVTLILILIICFSNSYSTIWYISEGGSGTKDGSSWGNAAADFPDLLQDYTVNPSQKWDTQGPIHHRIFL